VVLGGGFERGSFVLRWVADEGFGRCCVCVGEGEENGGELVVLEVGC